MSFSNSLATAGVSFLGNAMREPAGLDEPRAENFTPPPTMVYDELETLQSQSMRLDHDRRQLQAKLDSLQDRPDLEPVMAMAMGGVIGLCLGWEVFKKK